MKEKQENKETARDNTLTESSGETNSQIETFLKKIEYCKYDSINFKEHIFFPWEGDKSTETPTHFAYMFSKKRNKEGKNNFSTVDIHTKDFILKQNVLLISAYKMRDRGTEQHYALALKEDNEANRDIFLDFMLDYNDTHEGKMFPISFHFVRAELIRKAGGLEPIIEHKGA